MEPKTNKTETPEAYVRRIVRPIFDRVAKETHPNRLSVGSVRSPYCLYNPHNYRLYIDFSHDGMAKQLLYKDRRKNIRFRIINKTEVFFPEFQGCTITVKKYQVCIRHKENRWYRLSISTRVEEETLKILREKDQVCIKALRSFIKIYGGRSNLTILNRHSENKITHEDSIDLIPIKLKFHNKIVKKVYNQSNVEFSDPIFHVNYLTWRAIENIAPEIARALELMNPLRVLKLKVKTVDDVIKNKALVRLLGPLEKAQLEDWLFTLQ